MIFTERMYKPQTNKVQVQLTKNKNKLKSGLLTPQTTGWYWTHAIQFFVSGQKMAGVHSVHQALT